MCCVKSRMGGGSPPPPPFWDTQYLWPIFGRWPFLGLSQPSLTSSLIRIAVAILNMPGCFDYGNAGYSFISESVKVSCSNWAVASKGRLLPPPEPRSCVPTAAQRAGHLFSEAWLLIAVFMSVACPNCTYSIHIPSVKPIKEWFSRCVSLIQTDQQRFVELVDSGIWTVAIMQTVLCGGELLAIHLVLFSGKWNHC